VTQGGWSNGTQVRVVIVEDTPYSGLFFYSPTIGPGNLVGSWAAMAGEDPYGNAYPQGIQIGLDDAPRVQIGLTGGAALIDFPSTVPGEHNAAAMQATDDMTFSQLLAKSAQMTDTTDYVATSLQSSSDDGTDMALWHANYIDEAAVVHILLSVGLAGAAMTGSVTAVQPGTGLSRTNVAVPEVWHTAELTSAFSSGGADQAPRYLLQGIAGGRVLLDGVAYTTGAATAAGSEMFVLPAGYIPQTRKRFGCVNSLTGVTLDGTVVEVAPITGIVTIQASSAAIGQQVTLENLSFPVD
jgi:hypothetical protein